MFSSSLVLVIVLTRVHAITEGSVETIPVLLFNFRGHDPNRKFSPPRDLGKLQSLPKDKPGLLVLPNEKLFVWVHCILALVPRREPRIFAVRLSLLMGKHIL